ncbi:MAG TPA: PilC/PilY family type IV pilus protein [Polyangia bacterium]|jgi:type IV pilus assembly protein PilY1|nr:PilC/PilY family type IV pilus protein [Polyangia bacterium]
MRHGQRYLILLWGLLGTWALPAQAQQGTVCYNTLDQQTYPQGFRTSDFQNVTQAIISGNAQLDVGAQALDINRIVLPFDQNVRVRYVYRNAGASHTLGWFYLDQLIPDFIDTSGNLVDADRDGIADLFETAASKRPRTGLWQRTGSNSLPDLLIGSSYSDGGTYPHIPNLLEQLVDNGGGMVFQLCDDDTDTSVWNNLAPVGDSSTASDGIPDYDVNGDGTVGNEADRVADLGIIRGGREVVFFAITYYTVNITERNLGLSTSNNNRSSALIPLFSKAVLNPEVGLRSANTQLQRIAIGCARDDSACYSRLGATLGWLDNAAINRLNSAPYNYLRLDNTVISVRTDANANVPQFVVAAPQSAPNRWVVAFDDQPQTSSSDADFNDVVFIIERTNGGQVLSNLISSDIRRSDIGETTISRVRIRRTVSFPAPCGSPPDTRIDISISVDDGASWRRVDFPASSPTEATIDLLDLGITGNQLRWRADFVTNIDGCQPRLDTLSIGYEALLSSEYQSTEPIPVANTLFRATYETPDAGWTVVGGDRSNRGHLHLRQLYNASTLAESFTELWDAGTALASRSADARTIYYVRSGAARPFATTEGTNLYSLVLPSSVRDSRFDGRLVYDLNGDGRVNDTDAGLIVQFTRGIDPSGAQRAWKLGAILHSTPAIVGPVPYPWWLDGTATPATERTALIDYAAQNAQRRTVAIVGAQDGMLHGFNAGSFRYGDDPSTGTAETRGYFAVVNNQRDFGDGSELWAFVPPSEIDRLRNNLPAVASYRPNDNPHAEVDGAITASDVYYSGAIHTVAVAGHGAGLPYLTAIDVSSPTQPLPVWASDWTDADFHGTSAAPAVAPVNTAQGRRFAVVTTSGVAVDPDDLYLYVIEVATGSTLSKVRLGVTGSLPLGSVGSPSLIDSDGDGMIDRAYLADTSGRLWRVETATGATCVLYDLREPVFSSLAVTSDAQGVHLFVGGGDNPDSPDTGGPFHYFAIDDTNRTGECRSDRVRLVYSGAFGSGEKLWATPVVGGDSVYFATAAGSLQDACVASTSPSGNLYGLATVSTGAPALRFQPVALATGKNGRGKSAVVGIRAYDGHVIINTSDGTTTLVGAQQWNNPQAGGGAVQTTLGTSAWYEQ